MTKTLWLVAILSLSVSAMTFGCSEETTDDETRSTSEDIDVGEGEGEGEGGGEGEGEDGGEGEGEDGGEGEGECGPADGVGDACLEEACDCGNVCGSTLMSDMTDIVGVYCAADCSETQACPNETDLCVGFQSPDSANPTYMCMPYGTISCDAFKVKIFDDPSKITQTSAMQAVIQTNKVNSTMPWTPKPNFSQQAMGYAAPADPDAGTEDSIVFTASGLIGTTEQWQFAVIVPETNWAAGTLTMDENTTEPPFVAQVIKAKGNLMAGQISEVWIKAINASNATMTIDQPGTICDAAKPGQCNEANGNVAHLSFSIDMFGFDVSLDPAAAGGK
jgi:hypothetical protein